MANEVRLTLPPESMQWGRSVESRLEELQTLLSNIKSEGQMTNAKLAGVSRLVNNISTRDDYVFTDIYNFKILMGLVGFERGTFPYSSTTNPTLVTTTNGSGKLIVNPGGQFDIVGDAGYPMRIRLGVFAEALKLGELADESPTFSFTYNWNVSDTPVANFTVSGTGLLELEPNTEYEVRTQFYYFAESLGPPDGGWLEMYVDQAWLSVTKIGL